MKKVNDFAQLTEKEKAQALLLGFLRLKGCLPKRKGHRVVLRMRRATHSLGQAIFGGVLLHDEDEKWACFAAALDHLRDLRHDLLLCRDLGFRGDFEHLLRQADEAGKMLTRLVQSLET